VKRPADSPYEVAFAIATASSSVSNGSSATTGPKISSVATRQLGLTSAMIVGGT
jgi:hypothetical protein